MKGGQVPAIRRRFLDFIVATPRQTSGFDLRSHNQVIALRTARAGLCSVCNRTLTEAIIAFPFCSSPILEVTTDTVALRDRHVARDALWTYCCIPSAQRPRKGAKPFRRNKKYSL